MRAWEITLFVIIAAQIAQVFIAGIGLFPNDYLGLHGTQVTNTTNQTGSTGYTTGDYNAQSQTFLQDQTTGQTQDTITLGLGFLISATFSLLYMILTIITVIPTLLIFFQCPLPLAIVIQGLVYYSLFWSFMQWKAGRSGVLIQ